MRRSAARYLGTDHLRHNLVQRSVRGGLAILLSQHAKALIDLAAQLALARILAPSDFGLVAMVLVVTRFAALFVDLGLSTATIQRETLTGEQISALFWVNVLVGGALAVLLVAIAPVVAWLYGEPRLIGILAVSASAMIFAALTVQHQALLQRQMQFTILAIIGVVAVTLAAVVAVALALRGAGYWSLVVMHLTYSATMAVGVWTTCAWRPRWVPKLSGVRSMLAFGGNLTGFDLVDYAARNVDRVLVGGFWGAQWVGLYAQAVELYNSPIKQINAPVAQVTVPALSRLQNDPGAFRRYYLKSLSSVLVLATPITALLLVLAPEFIAVFLGPKWLEAAPILRCLAVCGLVQPILNTTQWLFRAMGRARQLLRWGLCAAVASSIALLIGLPLGVRTMALCYTVCTLLLTVPCVRYAIRATSVTSWDVWKTSARPLASALLAACPAVALKLWLGPHWPLWAVLVVAASSLVITYAVTMFFAMGMTRYLSFHRPCKLQYSRADTSSESV
ncbi:MAG: hypothetical protein A2V70_04235 [Planctomycetes bacterium RBG_13_63_9]|nr:MAG: hypothetical protein A2V70_04235 [Planctomycetes bacterium RBG_13_63_9]